MEQAVWQPPIYDPDHTRVVVADNRVVGVAATGYRVLRFGPCRVPALTVGPVATHPDYAGKGIGSLVMDDVAETMRHRKILLAYTQGIPGFYHRFDYFPYLAKSKITVELDAMSAWKRKGRSRRMQASDISCVAKVYKRATANRIGAANRDTTIWTWLLKSAGASFFFHKPSVILDEKKRVCGYFTLDPQAHFDIREIVVDQNPTACAAAIAAVYQAAKRAGVVRTDLKLPWDDGLMTFCRQHVGGEYHAYCSSDGRSLMCIGDFESLMKRLAPLYAQRLRQWGHGFNGNFGFSNETKRVGFHLSGGELRVDDQVSGPTFIVPARWVPGLLTGYYTPDDLSLTSGVKIPADLRPVLRALFPRRWPFICQADNY